jgi:PAS domain S-box-containing protein
MVFSLLADQCFYAAELSAELNINPITHGCNGVSDNTHLSKLRIGSVILSTLFLAAEDDSWRLPLALLYFAASAGLFTIKYLVLPHYNDFAQALHLARTLAAVLTGAVMLISASRALEGAPAHQHDIVILYLASMPLTVVIGMLAVTHRYAHVGSAPAQELTTPSLMILAARARLRRFLLQIAAHGDTYVADSAYLQEERLAMAQDFDRLLTVALGRFPDSAPMRIFAALFYTHVLDNRNLAYAQLKELPPTEDLPLRYAFLVNQLRALLDAATQKHQSIEVQAYIEFKQRKEVADTASMGCLASLLSFWTELLRPLPDADALITLAVAARAQLQTCHVNYKALLEINPNSVPVLRTYGLLLLDLVGELPRASALFARADTVEHERSVALMTTAQSGDFLSRVDANLDIFDERNAVFGISVARQSMGEVETINPAVTRMFGLQSKDIVGDNISRIIPSPIAEVHNDILERYLVHKISRIVNYTRMAFGLHASGYIFPVHLYVRWADEGNAKFLGVLQSVPLDNDVHLMLDPQKHTVSYATPNASALLGLSLRAVASGGVTAQSLIPSLAGDDGETRLDAMRSRLGLESVCKHALTGATTPCRVWCVETDVLDHKVMFLRVLMDTAAHDDAEQQIIDDEWDSDDQTTDNDTISLADRFASALESSTVNDAAGAGVGVSLNSGIYVDSLNIHGNGAATGWSSNASADALRVAHSPALESVPESAFEPNSPSGTVSQMRKKFVYILMIFI